MPRRFESVRSETIMSEKLNNWTLDVIAFLASCSIIVFLLISSPPPQHYILAADPEHEQLCDLIQQLLIYEPRRRISATDALKHPLFSSLLNRNSLDRYLQEKVVSSKLFQ